MVRYNRISEYMTDLKRELKGVDDATMVDAIDDATEHLEMMVEDLIEEGDAKNRKEAVSIACDSYGKPSLIAQAYIKSDMRYKKEKEQKKQKRMEETLLQSVFNVYKDPYSYLGILYFMAMLPLGIIYFTYVITMLSLSLGLAITIIGIPLLFVVLLSIHPISWLQGRFTEAFLGIKMPKKPRKLRARGNAWERIKAILKDPRLYSSLLYLILMLPLGIIYFTVVVTFLSISVAFAVTPILAIFGVVTGYPVGLPGEPWFLSLQAFFGVLMSIFTLTLTLHVSNLLGAIQGCVTRWLLLKR